MIKKLTYDTDKCIIDCDGVIIPSHNVMARYSSESARPFIYFVPNANAENYENGFAIVGPNGSTHGQLVNQNLMTIKGRFQMKKESDLLEGRIWTDINDFGCIITLWDKEYGYPISSGLINNVKEALIINEGIDIGDMWLVFLCENCDYYLTTVDDYIFGGYSNKMDLIPAFEREQSILRHGRGSADKYKDWDYNNQGVGYLGYHLMTRQDESKGQKLVLSESDIKDMVVECVNRILAEHSNMKTLYHFTTFDRFYQIAKSNTLESSNRTSEFWDGNRHISLTRHKSNYEGYGSTEHGYNVRICLDTEKMSSRHDVVNIKPMEFYSPQRFRGDSINGEKIGNQDSSKSRYQSEKFYQAKQQGLRAPEFQNQAEEGLQLTPSYNTEASNLDNLSKYVTRVDILWTPLNDAIRDYHSHLYELSSLQVISETDFASCVPIFVYSEKRDFSIQNGNCIELRKMINYFNTNICDISKENAKKEYEFISKCFKI